MTYEVGNPKIEVLLKRAGQRISNFYNTEKVVNWVLEEIERKRKLFPYWKKKIRFLYASYNKNKNHKNQSIKSSKDKISYKYIDYFYDFDEDEGSKKDFEKISENNLKKIIPMEKEFQSIKFFKSKFEEIFRYYFTQILPFEDENLTISKKSEIFFKDLIIKCSYSFSSEDLIAFQNFKEDFNVPEEITKIIEFFFSIIIHSMSIIIQKIIQDNYRVEMMCGNMDMEKRKIDFNICIRQKESIINSFYFKTQLFHFSEIFNQIPIEYREKLKTEKDLIYLVALQRYPGLKPYVNATLQYLKIKCETLGNIIPMLDFINFVFSRVEDSNDHTPDIINEVLEKIYNNISQEKKDSFFDLFKYINKNAALFSTFQSNNKSQIKEQFQLFVFAHQYFVGQGIDFVLNSDVLFLKEIFRKKIQKLYDKFPHYKKYSILLEKFLLHSFTISISPAIEVIFQNIFKIELKEFNELFFNSFAYSMQSRIEKDIENFNNKYDNLNLRFNELIKFIIDVLDYTIDKIFLGDDPKKVSLNFRDTLGRYFPKKLALRATELLIFKESPISDRIWQNFALSKNKKTVINYFKNYLRIPEDYFYSEKKILHIVMMYQYSLDKSMYLEEWLIDGLIYPFFQFIDRIIEDLNEKKKINEEFYLKKQLANSIMKIISKSIIDDRTMDELEQISEWLTNVYLFDIQNLIE